MKNRTADRIRTRLIDRRDALRREHRHTVEMQRDLRALVSETGHAEAGEMLRQLERVERRDLRELRRIRVQLMRLEQRPRRRCVACGAPLPPPTTDGGPRPRLCTRCAEALVTGGPTVGAAAADESAAQLDQPGAA